MDSNAASRCASAADRDRLGPELAAFDPPDGGGLRLSERASLLAVLLLSLGLWAAIWAAVAALVAPAQG